MADNPEGEEREIATIIHQLEILDTKEKLKEVGETISNSEKRGLDSNLRRANKEFSDLAERLASLEEKDIGSIIRQVKHNV